MAEEIDKKNFIIPLSNGILEHRERIGSAIWLFLLFIDWTIEETDGVGKVLNGKVVQVTEMMSALNLKERQVRTQLERLHAGNYIRLKRTPRGYCIEVLKSKKWTQKSATLNGGNGLHDRSATFCRNKEDIAVDLTNKEKDATGSKEVIQRTAKRPRSKTSDDASARDFIDLFFNRYQQAFGEKYLVNVKKDGALSKRLVAHLGMEKLAILLENFFTSDDPFILSSGHTIGVFYSQINKLARNLRQASRFVG